MTKQLKKKILLVVLIVLLVAIVVVAQVNQSKKEERNKKMLESIQDWFKENQNGASDPSGTPADFGAFFPWFFKKAPQKQLTQEDIEEIAEIQYKSMSIAGTEENELFSSLIGVSAENLVKVKEAFGTKKYNSLTGTGPSLFNFYVAYPKDLFGWYKGELNDELLARMQAVWDPTGLKIKG
jgi:hypothetical protein